jgi:hypothetical protein
VRLLLKNVGKRMPEAEIKEERTGRNATPV